MAEWKSPGEAAAALVHDGNGGEARERGGLKGDGPVAVITNLCVLQPHPVRRELQVAITFPGVSRDTIAASAGGQVQFVGDCDEAQCPSPSELEALRDLKALTAAAHGVLGEAA